MIAAGVDDHVGTIRHVTLDALGGFGLLLVEVVIGRVVLGRQMTLSAELVALEVEVEGMGVVAVSAAHIVPEHLALDKGAVDVHLLQDLPIGVVEAFSKDLRHEIVEEGASGIILGAYAPPAGVAGRARFELAARFRLREADAQAEVSRARG